MSGGIESGFKKVEKDKYEPRLFQIKGRRNIRMQQVGGECNGWVGSIAGGWGEYSGWERSWYNGWGGEYSGWVGGGSEGMSVVGRGCEQVR